MTIDGNKAGLNQADLVCENGEFRAQKIEREGDHDQRDGDFGHGLGDLFNGAQDQSPRGCDNDQKPEKEKPVQRVHVALVGRLCPVLEVLPHGGAPLIAG
jgi:hypothetical protein